MSFVVCNNVNPLTVHACWWNMFLFMLLIYNIHMYLKCFNSGDVI